MNTRPDRAELVALVEFAESIALRLRGGAALADAVAGAHVAPALPAAVAELSHHTAAGARLSDEVSRLAAVEATEIRALAGALVIAGRGGSGADALTGVAHTLRDRIAVLDEAHALGTQARASAMVVAAAPVAALVITALTNRSAAAQLFLHPVGRVALSAGVVLEVVGVVTMRRIVAAVLR